MTPRFARPFSRCGAALVTLLLVTAAAPPLSAQTLPTDFVDENVISGLDMPVGLAFLPDGRLFLIEQTTGRLRLLVNGALAAVDPVLTVDSLQTADGEQGLLGLAVDPRWPASPYVYLQLSHLGTPGSIRIQRYRCAGDLSFTGDGSLTADLTSQFEVTPPLPDSAWKHNGGTLRVGPDGMLYSSLGDDGPACPAQYKNVLLGKILRLDVSRLPDGPGGPPPIADITPADNPFVAYADPRAHLVWEYGLRNPFRFHIDPVSGALMIADVGQAAYEEVDWAPAGGMNFGWPRREGPYVTPIIWCGVIDSSTFVAPVAGYDRDDPAWPNWPSAIISGGFYRRPPGATSAFPPEYESDYFYLDHYRSFVRRLETDGANWFTPPPVPGQPNATDWASGVGLVGDMQVGPDGSLWYCRLFTTWGLPTGYIHRIRYTGTLGVERDRASEVEFAAPRPTPGRGPVRFAWTQPRAAAVTFALYDAGGRLIRTLVAEERTAGPHAFEWDGLDARGRPVPPGLVLARIELDGRSYVRRAVVLR